MEYNIKLYVHGVPPEGQQVWGSMKGGQSYIENFYGRKSSVITQLITEIIPLNGNNNYYYTYLRGKDIIGRDGRAGSSYFALTLCMNHLYTDLVNLYNILDASFNKFVVGNVLKQVSGNYGFIATDFNQHDTLFKELEKEIVHYLMQFSTNSDFISSNGMNNANGRISQINLFECNHQVTLSQINSNGGISISPYYPSVQVANTLKQKDAEIASVKQLAQNQIADIKEQCNLKIQKAEQEKDDGIKEVEKKYANSALEISSLKTNLKEVQKNCQDLKVNNEELKKQVQHLKQIKLENERKNVEIERLNNIISNFKSHLVGLSEIANNLGIGQFDVEKTKKKYNDRKKVNEENRSNEGYKLNMKHVIMALASLFVLCIGVFIFKGCFKNSENDSKSNIEKVVIVENKDSSESNNPVKEIVGDEPMEKKEQFTITIGALQNLYPKMRIDISGISKSNPMKYGANFEYKASLKEIDGDDLGGIWESKDFLIEGNRITPKHRGDCIINYVVNDTVLVRRSINVK